MYRDDSRDEGDRPVLSLAGGARSCGRMTHRRRPGTLPRRGRSRRGGGLAVEQGSDGDLAAVEVPGDLLEAEALGRFGVKEEARVRREALGDGGLEW